MRRLEQAGIAVLVLALVAVPTAIHGWPATVAGNALTGLLVASGLTLVWWRSHPRLVTIMGGSLWMAAGIVGEPRLFPDPWFPDPAFAIMALLATVAALGWSGRAAWVVTL